MAEKQSKNKWHTPAERIMMLGFAAVILLGTILLCLPVSAADGKSVYWLDALFTATTSVCVTGLVTVPTATTWSTFGKIVILGLIQFGGLGIMACLTMVFLILRRKISLQSRKLIQDTYNLPVLKGSVGIVMKITFCDCKNTVFLLQSVEHIQILLHFFTKELRHFDSAVAFLCFRCSNHIFSV